MNKDQGHGTVTPMPNEEHDKMRAALEQLKRNKQYQIELNEILAEIRKQAFDAHVRQGFTKEQALELVKKL